MNIIPQNVISYLSGYQGNSSFIISVRDQYLRKGMLSDKQIAAVERNMQPKAPVVLQQVSQPTYPVGTVLELKSFIARKLAEQFHLAYQFRNVEILETLRETEKAVQVRVRLSPRYSTCCSICGRALDTKISRATGIGPVCASKWGIDRYSSGDAGEILKQLEAKLGEVKMDEPVWIARSQIKGRVEAPAAAESVQPLETALPF